MSNNKPIKRCPYNDCGWCYSKDKSANDTQGQCNKPQECPVNIEINHPPSRK